jgi:hypothetical protein
VDLSASVSNGVQLSSLDAGDELFGKQGGIDRRDFHFGETPSEADRRAGVERLRAPALERASGQPKQSKSSSAKERASCGPSTSWRPFFDEQRNHFASRRPGFLMSVAMWPLALVFVGRLGHWSPDLRDGRDTGIADSVLLQDTLSDPIGNPLPITVHGHVPRLGRIRQIRALTEHGWNLGVPGESEAAANHPEISLARRGDQMLLDTRRQSVTVGPPEKGFRPVQRVIGYRIVMNTYEHSAGSLAVGEAYSIVQFYEVIVLANHNSAQAGATQFVANSPCGVKSEILFPEENWGASTAHSAAILPAVTRVNHDCGKMSAPRW